MTLAVGAAADMQINAEIARAVALQQGLHDTPPGGLVQVGAYLQLGKAIAHALHVRAKAYQLAIVGGDDLVDAITEQEAPVHRRYAGFAHRQKVAVKVYGCHRVCASLSAVMPDPRSAPAAAR